MTVFQRIAIPLAMILLGIGVTARSATVTPSVAYGAAGGTVSMGALNVLGTGFRTWAAGVSGAAVITDAVEVAIAGGRVAMAAGAVVPWVGIASAAAIIAAAGLGYAAGSVLYEAFIAERCVSAASGGWFCDPGVPKTPQNVWQWRGDGESPWAGSAEAAMAYAHSKYCTAMGASVASRGAIGYPPGFDNRVAEAWTPCKSVPGYPPTTEVGIAMRVSGHPETTLGCGPISDGSTGVVGADGLCNTFPIGSTAPALAVLPAVAAEKLARHPPVDPVPIAKAAVAAGADLEPYKLPLPLTGPAVVAGTGTGSTTTYTPPGATAPVTVTTPPPSIAITYEGSTYNYTTTYTATAPITAAPGTPVTTTGPPPDITVCGLPGKPKCIIDETGTADTYTAPKSDTAFDAIKAVVAAPASAFPVLPALNWAFTMPTGCSPIPMTAFAPFFTSLDICGVVKPVFDDIMSFVWVAGGLFGAWSLFMRDTLAT